MGIFCVQFDSQLAAVEGGIFWFSEAYGGSKGTVILLLNFFLTFKKVATPSTSTQPDVPPCFMLSQKGEPDVSATHP